MLVLLELQTEHHWCKLWDESLALSVVDFIITHCNNFSLLSNEGNRILLGWIP